MHDGCRRVESSPAPGVAEHENRPRCVGVDDRLQEGHRSFRDAFLLDDDLPCIVYILMNIHSHSFVDTSSSDIMCSMQIDNRWVQVFVVESYVDCKSSASLLDFEGATVGGEADPLPRVLRAREVRARSDK